MNAGLCEQEYFLSVFSLGAINFKLIIISLRGFKLKFNPLRVNLGKII